MKKNEEYEVNPYPAKWDISHSTQECQEKWKGLESGEEDIEANQVDKGASVVAGTYEANIDRDLSIEESDSDIGSSGWSSSAGMSSLNTGASVDSNEYFQSSLAAIGAASNVHKKFMATSPTAIYPVPARGSDDSSQSDA